MTNRWILMIRRCAVAFAVAVLLAGCGKGIEPSKNSDLFPAGNLPPTTEIVNPRLSGQEATFDLLVSWKGYDEDGTIAGFEIAVDDTSSWYFTTAFESLFVFHAQQCCLVDTLVRSGRPDSLIPLSFDFHTLFVRALDNQGAEDATPDRISFTSTNLFPKTVILRGPSLERPNQITARTVIIEWEGQDEDGEVVGYRYHLDDRPWASVGADCTLVRFTELSTAEFAGDLRGKHKFDVLSIDNAGAEEQFTENPRNELTWESVGEIAGTLIIRSNVMGSRSGVNTNEGQIFEGTRVFFDWRGDASLYGGIILCYQHAFDQQEVFSACDIDARHYPPDRDDFVPTIGSHNLFVNAFDDAGQTIHANFPFVVLRGPGSIDSLDRKILYVDDFDNGPTEDFPGDAQEDRYWLDSLLTGFAVASQFDCDAQNDIPSARLIGAASTVVWYMDDSGTQLEGSNQQFNFRNPLGPYVNAGGNLILCGNNVTDAYTPDNYFDPVAVLNPGCPHSPQNSYRGAGGFTLDWAPAFCDTGLTAIFDIYKISRAYSPSLNGETKTRLKRLKSLALNMVADAELDSTKKGFGADGRPLIADGLKDCEAYIQRLLGVNDPDVVIPLWSYIENDGADRGPCALFIPESEETGRGNVLILGFPPYYFHTLEMQAVFRTFLTLFGERFGG